jgi:phenylalanine-4-hydroxylase
MKSKYQAYTPDRNGIIPYSDDDHAIWSTLYQKQIDLVQDFGSTAYLLGMKKLNLSQDQIPQPKSVSSTLYQETGWVVEPVPALIDFSCFYNLLAQKKFPAASFIRSKEELKYLKEPDIFHEIFGHCPMLTDPDFAAFVHKVGIFGVNLPKEFQPMLGRLFWFTVEFGLIQEDNNLKAYGAGILSSHVETTYSLNSKIPQRHQLDLIQLLRTPYRYDELQRTYFIINSYHDLYNIFEHDLLNIFNEVKEIGLLPNLHLC